MRCIGSDAATRACLFSDIFLDCQTRRWLYFSSEAEYDALRPNTTQPFVAMIKCDLRHVNIPRMLTVHLH